MTMQADGPGAGRAPSTQAFSSVPILVLGAGAVVQELYLPALAGLGLAGNVRVIDRAPGQLGNIAATWPQIKTQAGDFREILRCDDVPVVPRAAIVALPNGLHAEACVQAAAADYDVLCDKPLALHAEDCESIFTASLQAGRIVDVNMCRRYLPSMVAMRRALQEGLIGDLRSVDVEDGDSYSWNPATSAPFERENGGVLADMGVHYIDLVEHLVGRLKPRAYRDDWAGGVEANAVLELEAETHIPVRIALSRTRELRNRLVVRGSRGTLTAWKNEFGGCLWSSDAGLTAQLAAVRPFADDWAPTLLSCFAQKISEFLETICKRGEPGVSAKDAASTIGIIEWAYVQRSTKKTMGPAVPRTAARPGLAPGRAVVTGGTGFIGSHLVGRLAQLGFQEISVPIRRINSCAEVARYPVSLQQVNLLDIAQVRNAVEGARWVFHLAYGRDGADLDRLTIEGTRNVVDAAIAARCDCVVVLSTVYVFGDADGVIDEIHPHKPKGGRYGTEKAAMERWCLTRSASSSPTRIVILNPSCVYGPGGKTFTELPNELAKAGAFCWIEGGSGIANYCFVDNLVDAILLAAGIAEAHGQRFIVNDGACSWREFLRPFTGGDADRWPSFTARELADLHRAMRPKWSAALRAVTADRQLRDLIKARLPTAALMALIRRVRPGFLAGPRPSIAPQLAAPPDKPQSDVPPIWLADLFGPASTRFSSVRASSVLGWSPRVKLAQGQDLAMHWLTGDEWTLASAEES
jgi:predicted dehydrogenase/nucleoside-diphosphate-sugar epimerase